MAVTWSSVVLLLVFSCCRAQHSLQCSQEGPEDCHFHEVDALGDWHGTWCSWTNDGGWAFNVLSGTTWKAYEIRLSGETALLTSRLVCSTQGQMHCMSFSYKFDTPGVIDLNVYVTHVTNGSKIVLTSLSSSTGSRWEEATVSIETDFDFYVEFEAKRRSNSKQDSTVYIDQIKNDWSLSCNFNFDIFCSWRSRGGWKNYTNPNDLNDRYLGLKSSSTSALLVSYRSCSKQEQNGCLSFWYAFSVSNSIDLNVYITNVDQGGKHKIWSLSSVEKLSQWHKDAAVPISTHFSFIVKIEAVRRPGSQDSAKVWIDNIVHQRDSPCSVQPPDAEVSTSTSVAPTVTSTVTHTTTRPNGSPTSSNVPSTSVSTRPLITDKPTSGKPTDTPNPSTTSTVQQSTSTESQNTPADDDEASTKIRVIVGGVTAAIAVIVVVVVVVVLLIFCKRNKQQSSKSIVSNRAVSCQFDYRNMAVSEDISLTSASSRGIETQLDYMNVNITDHPYSNVDELPSPNTGAMLSATSTTADVPTNTDALPSGHLDIGHVTVDADTTLTQTPGPRIQSRHDYVNLDDPEHYSNISEHYSNIADLSSPRSDTGPVLSATSTTADVSVGALHSGGPGLGVGEDNTYSPLGPRSPDSVYTSFRPQPGGDVTDNDYLEPSDDLYLHPI